MIDAAGPRASGSTASRVFAGDDLVAFAETDLEGRLLRVNQRFCALAGREAPELVGVTLSELLHEDDRAGHALELRALVREGVSYVRDERYLRPDGASVWATNEIERCADWTRQPGLLVAAQASAAQVARAELGRARAMDELRRRDEFLNLLSHELRSPLAAILVWARLLRESGGEGVDAERGLEVIERSGRAIERALDDLVHVARIVTGKPQQISHTLLDLRAVATAAADTVGHEADRKGVKLARVLPANVVTVSGDPGLLQEAVTRLLDNAVKFTPAGGHVELSLDTSGTEARIRVSDTGAGMSSRFLPLVFEPFRQDAMPHRAHRGLGLGLAIVRHVVTLQSGRVSASSPGPGQGSVFDILLPLATPAGPGGAAAGPPPTPA